MSTRSASAIADAPPEPPSPMMHVTVGMSRRAISLCELDGLPDVLVSRLLRDPRELSLELLELRRDAGTTEQAHVAQTRQAFAQSQLVVSRHSSRRAARAAQRTA